VNDGSDDTGCGGIEVSADAAKLMDSMNTYSSSDRGAECLTGLTMFNNPETQRRALHTVVR